MTELNCNELVELVTDYLEDALPPADRARFEEHLADCPGCEAYLGQMRVTLRVVGATETVDGDAPEMAALLEAFRAFHRTGT